MATAMNQILDSPGTETRSFLWAHPSRFSPFPSPPEDADPSSLQKLHVFQAYDNRQCPKFQ